MANGNPLLEVQIQPGMREDVDPALLPAGVPRYLQNTRCYQAGRLEKRPGTLPYGVTGFPTTGGANWLTSQGDRLVASMDTTRLSVTGPQIYEQETVGQSTQWASVGAHSAIVPERRFSTTSVANASGLVKPSCQVIGDLFFMAYTEINPTTRISAVTRDGRTLRTRIFSNCSKARLLYISASQTLYIIYCDSTSVGADDIKVAVVDQATLAVGAATTIDTVGGADFDVAEVTGAGQWIIALQFSATALRIRRMGGTVSLATVDHVTSNLPTCIGVTAVSGSVALIGYLDGAQVEVSVRDASTLASVANPIIGIAAGTETFYSQVSFVRVATGEWALAWGGTETSAAPSLETSFIYHARINSAGATTFAAKKVSHFFPASKLFATGADGTTGRQVYIWAVSTVSGVGVPQQPAHHVLELDQSGTSGSPNAFVAAISSDFHVASLPQVTNYYQHQPTVETFADGGQFATMLYWADDSLKRFYQGFDVVVFKAARQPNSATGAYRQAQDVGGALVVSGGCLYEHAGARDPSLPGYITENGFPYVPRLARQLVAGGAMTSGTLYSYCAVYCWVDALGHFHRSAPSAIVTATPSGGNLSVQLRAQTMLVTGRSHCAVSDLTVEFYRSWNGGPFYRVNYRPAGILTGGTTVSYTDVASDSSLVGNLPLYTDLGILETWPASGARLFCLGASRAFAVGWRENVVQVSKLLLPTAPIEFTDDDAFRVFLPEPIVALAWLDGALVVFCENGIYLVTGDGPDDKGNGGFSEPRRLPASVSCDESRSLLEVPQGLMFSGGGTIWLLPRGFGPPMPIGDPISKRLEEYPYVTSAVVAYDPGPEGRTRTAHFVVSNSDLPELSTTLTLVLDLERNAWSVDDLSCRVGATTSLDGTFAWLTSSWSSASHYPVRVLDVGQYQDYDDTGGLEWIETQVQFGDLRPFGVLGWGKLTRMQAVGSAVGACKVQLEAALNGSALTSVEKNFGAPQDTWYLEHDFEKHAGNSLALTFKDAAPSGGGTSPGVAFRSVAFEVVRDEGLRRSLDPSNERLAPP